MDNMTTLRRMILATAQDKQETSGDESDLDVNSASVARTIQETSSPKKKKIKESPKHDEEESSAEEANSPKKKGAAAESPESDTSAELSKASDPLLNSKEDVTTPPPSLEYTSNVNDEVDTEMEAGTDGNVDSKANDRVDGDDDGEQSVDHSDAVNIDVAASPEQSGSEEREISTDSRPPPRQASKKYASHAGRRVSSDSANGQKSPPSDDSQKEGKQDGKQVKKVRPKRTLPLAKGGEEESMMWVQCEKCLKWRDVPTSEGKKLSSAWYCELNTWKPQLASCSVPEKLAAEGIEAEGSDGFMKKSGALRNGNDRKQKKRKRNRGDTHFDKNSGNVNLPSNGNGSKPGKPQERGNSNKRGQKKGGASDTKRGIGMNMIPGSAGVKGKKAWNWVMCETCNQWRKLPLNVDVDRLPDKWYCYMNEWDKERASCSAPQEADEGQTASEEAAILEGKSSIVRLPDGVNLYGGQFFPLRTDRKDIPNTYRELIVNHYRHFSKYDLAANAFYNARYQDSSVFVPRGNIRKPNKKMCFDGGVGLETANGVAQPSKESSGISAASLIKSSTFRELVLPNKPPVVTEGETLKKEDSDDEMDAYLDESVSRFLHRHQKHNTHIPLAMLKLSKPWKQAGGWIGDRDYFCTPSG